MTRAIWGRRVFAKDDTGYLGVEVADLAWKEIEHLTFSTCNSGNPDVYNLAYAFKKSWKKDKRVQNTWYTYVDKFESGEPVRRRIGYRLISRKS